MEPRFNEPLYNEVLGTTNDFLRSGQCMEQNLDLTKSSVSTSRTHSRNATVKKPQYNEQMSTCDRKRNRKKMLKRNAKQTNEDKIYVYSSFKQFCLPVLVSTALTIYIIELRQ